MTKRQKEIFDFIKSHINEKQYPPTIREIATELGIKSSSTVHEHLSNMRKKGYINFIDTLPRTLSIVEGEV